MKLRYTSACRPTPARPRRCTARCPTTSAACRSLSGPCTARCRASPPTVEAPAARGPRRLRHDRRRRAAARVQRPRPRPPGAQGCSTAPSPPATRSAATSRRSTCPSALALARHALDADITVVAMGPGVVGTGTRLGTTALEAAPALDAAAALGGQPVLCARVSSERPAPPPPGREPPQPHRARPRALAGGRRPPRRCGGGPRRPAAPPGQRHRAARRRTPPRRPRPAGHDHGPRHRPRAGVLRRLRRRRGAGRRAGAANAGQRPVGSVGCGSHGDLEGRATPQPHERAARRARGRDRGPDPRPGPRLRRQRGRVPPDLRARQGRPAGDGRPAPGRGGARRRPADHRLPDPQGGLLPPRSGPGARRARRHQPRRRHRRPRGRSRPGGRSGSSVGRARRPPPSGSPPCLPTPTSWPRSRG